MPVLGKNKPTDGENTFIQEGPDLGVIASSIRRIFRECSLDEQDPHLAGTPARVAKMYAEVFSSVGKDPFKQEKLVTVFPNPEDENGKSKYNEMVLIDKIPFSSFCAHHLVPFSGLAWVVYVPGESVLGLSKFSRITQWFCAKPQIQEDLTLQVAGFLIEVLKPKGLLYLMRGVHECTRCRGVRNLSSSGMVTSSIYGCMEESESRDEALSLIEMSMRL